MKTLFITHDYFKQHLTGEGHPECPERITAIQKAVSQLDLPSGSPREATVDELKLCHDPDYITLVEQECEEAERNIMDLSTGDVSICRQSYSIAKLAVGAALEAVDAVMQGKVPSAFVAARPPGHHAESNAGMGFCLFNNIAIASRYAQQKYGLERILIVDPDVHHGNGTQQIFYNDPSVYYFSTHMRNLYPPGSGTANSKGRGEGKGTTENHPIGISPRIPDRIEEAFDALEENMKAFKPQLVLISAGFDGHKEDPLAGAFGLTMEDFSKITQRIKTLADKLCDGRIVSLLEGGYNLDTIGELVATHIKALN